MKILTLLYTCFAAASLQEISNRLNILYHRASDVVNEQLVCADSHLRKFKKCALSKLNKAVETVKENFHAKKNELAKRMSEAKSAAKNNAEKVKNNVEQMKNNVEQIKNDVEHIVSESLSDSNTVEDAEENKNVL